jgi:adenosylcobinamide-GDP ribazoletransferase
MTATSSTGSDGFRLALGTLTILPTAPPTKVDRDVGARAMVLAPLVGGLLAVVAGLLLWLLGTGSSVNQPALPGSPIAGQTFGLDTNPFLSAALVVGLLAVLTRAMHLDGLADTVDGISSGKPAAEALDVMHRGDVGPFGVVTLVLALLLQVLALGVLVGAGMGPHAIFLALVVSRLALPLACLPGIPPARADGLGHVVAGTVTRGQAVLSGVLAVVVLLLLSLVSPGVDAWTQVVLFRAVVVAIVGLLAGWLLVHRAVRRLGGVTGDVLGAAVEVTFTTVLVVLTLTL